MCEPETGARPVPMFGIGRSRPVAQPPDFARRAQCPTSMAERQRGTGSNAGAVRRHAYQREKAESGRPETDGGVVERNVDPTVGDGSFLKKRLSPVPIWSP